ncbi:hypothetical protein [Taklimakanibacter albus]|uniref:Uncharacterized protein n=1 Tax=Taklimakanibacter albus TaxID=2800327 RepID=A0ACC5R457_9HYPH|nr:hypothetical protein [Aestuariivirga sp. YIM B02566]MBK1867347.1 hypothetical protein [Aestuariivirga sp. YIM B02566]
MRNIVLISIFTFLMLVPARAEDDNSESRSHVNEDEALKWCFSRFPSAEPAEVSSRSISELAPFKLEDTIAPPGLITKTETVGRLPGYIRKYKGVWIWPAITEPPAFAIFVERLTAEEMTIAFVSRATEENKDYRDGLRKNSRQKLTWNGTAFSAGPDGELESTTTIYISAFSDALLLIRANKREGGPPMCFISSKHY